MKKLLLFGSLLCMTSMMALAQLAPTKLRNHHAERRAATSPQKVANHNDLPQMMLTYDWIDSLNQWKPYTRYTYVYNVNGLVTERIISDWDGSNYIPYSRLTSSYNPQMLLENTVYYTWSSGVWVNNYKYDSQYDAMGNITLGLGSGWNGTSWYPSNGSQFTYTYVFTDRVSSKITQYLNTSNSTWINNWKEEFYFPTASGWSSDTYYNWNDTLSIWEPSGRDLDVVWHDYNKELPTSFRSQEYTNGVWVDSYRLDQSTYSQYDSYDLIYQAWNGALWNNDYREIVTVDVHDHTVGYVGMSWIGTWMQDDGGLHNYTYDLQGNTTEIIHQYWNSNNGQFELNSREVFSSFFTGTDVSNILNQSVSTYPNPCADHLNFSFSEAQTGHVQVALYDLKGTKRMEMMSPITSQTLTLPISDQLEAGTYIYHLATKAGQATGKVVVQR